MRRRQVQNLLVFDLLSLGAPMLLMGDEVRRTQGGNNNAYCHDDPTSWFDWTAVERHADLLRFTQGLIRMRRRVWRSVLDMPDDDGPPRHPPDASIEWSGVRIGPPDLGDDSHSVALTLRADAGALHLSSTPTGSRSNSRCPRPTCTPGSGDGSSTRASTRRTTSSRTSASRPR